MASLIRQFLLECIPPVVWSLYRRWFAKSGYYGDYSEWDYACKASIGYDSEVILEKVRDALVKVKNGEAVYERDSVLFDEIQYSWPLLAGLLWIASCNGNRLNLLDFGGSLGSSYYQNRAFLGHLNEFSWNVVEQEKFVHCGRELLEDQFLKFYITIEECLEFQEPNAILLSSVLPYLEDPYELLTKIVKQKIAFIVIDRTPILDGSKDRLTVQRVPVEIYDASYPAWILGKDKLLGVLEQDYEQVMHFDALGGSIFLGNSYAHDSGFIFRLKDAR